MFLVWELKLWWLCVIKITTFSPWILLIKNTTADLHYQSCKIRQIFSTWVEIICHDKLTHTLLCGDAATLLKMETGSLPEGKVKIRLESDGSLLDVDEDDVEKVFNHQISSELHQLPMTPGECTTASWLWTLGKPSDVWPGGGPGLSAVFEWVKCNALPASTLW